MWPFNKKKNNSSVSFPIPDHPHSMKNAGSSMVHVYNLPSVDANMPTFDKIVTEAYRDNVVSRRAIKLIVDSIAYVDISMEDLEEDETHDVLKLLRNPGYGRSYTDLITAIVSYRMLHGTAPIEAVYQDQTNEPKPDKPPVFLDVLRPDRVSILVDKAKRLAGYEYRPDPSLPVLQYPVNMFGHSNILMFKDFNPLHTDSGMSPALAAAASIDQYNQGNQWNKALLHNSARPSGVLYVNKQQETPSSVEVSQQIRDSLSSDFTTALNSGRPLVLEGDMEWQATGMSPVEMDFQEMKHSTARDICLAYGVPPQLLGIPGDNTYSNLAEARQALWEQTVLPLLDELIEKLNMWLIPRYGKDTPKLTYDKDSIEALSMRRLEKSEMLLNMPYLTDNEKRVSMGYTELDESELLELLLQNGTLEETEEEDDEEL